MANITLPPAVAALLAAIHDVGSGDIYTDADEYSGRVNAMESLACLAGELETLTEREVETALLHVRCDNDEDEDNEMETVTCTKCPWKGTETDAERLNDDEESVLLEACPECGSALLWNGETHETRLAQERASQCEMCGATKDEPHHDPSAKGKVTTLHRCHVDQLIGGDHSDPVFEKAQARKLICMLCRDGVYAIRRARKATAQAVTK